MVFDTRDLGPGSARTLTRTVPAPDHMAVELVRVPAGADLELDVQLEGVTEGVLVTATVTGPLAGECARCLEPFTSATKVRFQELFELAGDADPADDPDGTDNYRLDASGLLDLEPALRDALVLELPLSPLCEDDCQGLCVECGIRLADAEPDHRHEQRGSMWAALQDFRADEPNGHQPDGGPHEEDVPDPAAGPAMTTHRTDAAPGQAKEH
jgi:uncharacterized protein